MIKITNKSYRLTFALALVVATVLQFSGSANALAPANYAKSVSVQAGATYAGGAALTDYPVLVRLDTSITGFSYSQFALADGADLRFTAADGTTNLTHEVDQWNPGGVSTAWVKIPSLATAGGTPVVAYWGNANAAVDDPNIEADVWSNGFDFVYHLSDDQNDSGPGAHHLSTGSTSNDPNAIISDGQDISDGGTVMSPLDGYLGIAGGAERSFNAWVRINKAVPDANDGMIGWGAGGNGVRWEIRLENAAAGPGTVRVEVNGGFRRGTVTINDGNWYYVHVNMPLNGNTNNHDIYVNGALGNGASGARAIATGQSVAVNVGAGGQGNNSRPWAGQMDEVRVSTVQRPVDWVQANYDSQIPASTFNGFGTVNILQTQATLTPADAGPTNAATVVYTVVFEQVVTGVTAASFSLESLSGDTTGTVNGVIGGTGDTYTVTVENLSGDGDIRLNLSDVTGISPAAGASGGFAITMDNTGPTISYASSNLVVNSGGGTTISLSFNDPAGIGSVNLTGGSLIGAGSATATVNIVNGTTDSAQIVLTNITGSKGDFIQYEVAPGIATDSIGNTSLLSVTPLTTVGNPTFEFHWPLDGATTAVTNSSYYPDRDGAMLGDTAPAVGGGIIGSAGAVFDGSTTGGIVADSYSSVQGGTSRTISLWANASSDCYLFEYGTNANGRRVSMGLNTTTGQGTTGSLRGEFQGSFLIGNDADVLANNQWHHLAFVIADHDGSGVTMTNESQLYADGVLNAIDNQGTDRVVNTGSALPVFLGARTNGGGIPLNGLMDDVAIWSRVLNNVEITALNNVGRTLGYNAFEMDCLFELFAAQTGTETIQGEIWEPVASGLTGIQGIVEVVGGGTNLRLDVSGGGVRIPGAPIVNDPLHTDKNWNMFE